jgi:hypothetical protein
LLAVRPTLLRDSLHVLLARPGRLRVIDAEPWGLEILVAARRHQVDVVVVSLQARPGIPSLVTHLLGELPGITVVGIDLEREYARIYREGRDVRTVSCETGSDLIRVITAHA